MKEIKTEGQICVDDQNGYTYYFARIEYLEREDGYYKYTFYPNYSVIDLLGPEVYQGIPGLNMDLRKTCYVRENMVPVFMSERTPGESREDLWDLLQECDMDYLNRLEWLIRCRYTYSGDPYYVIRYEEGKDYKINSVGEIANRSSIILRKLLEAICKGRRIVTDTVIIDDFNRADFYRILMPIYLKEKSYITERKKTGIQKAAEEGKYKGRRRKLINEVKLLELMDQYQKHNITGSEVANRLGISLATFNRRYREYVEEHSKISTQGK